MIYWTKRKIEFEEGSNLPIITNEFETIKESDEDYVTDGNGFEVDMNGIEYRTYIKDPDKYEIIEGKLFEK